MPITLKEHIRLSREAVSANKAKGNRHSELLKQLYPDPCRFLEEILQNTEDAYARKDELGGSNIIRFSLFHDHIDIHHNGIDFNEDDLKAITTVGGSTKTAGSAINQIGKFGIGFRSVYGVTDHPEIHCGIWHFRIDDFEILEEIEPQEPDDGFGTLLRLPFRKNESTNLFRKINQGLKNLNEYSLLFLEHLNIIEIIRNNNPEIIIKREFIKIEKNLTKVIITFSCRKKYEAEFLLLKQESLRKTQRFAVAFRIHYNNDGREEIIPDDTGRVFVFFPTLQETHLRFLLHGHFTTTPTREYVPFDKFLTPENYSLTEAAAAFTAKSLEEFRDIGLLVPSFFNVLPLIKPANNAANNIFTIFNTAIINALQHKKLLPARGRVFARTNQLAMTQDEIIPELINKKGLELLYQRNAWLDEGFKLVPHLTNFLENELGIRIITPESFAFRLAMSPDYIRTHKRDWFIKLYQFLALYPRLWDEAHQNEYYSLRSKEIILLQNGRFSYAFDREGTATVFMPSKKRSGSHIIDRKVIKDDGALNFFRMMGIKECNAEIKKVQDIIKEEKTTPQKSQLIIASPTEAVEGMDLLFWKSNEHAHHLQNIIPEDFIRFANLPAALMSGNSDYNILMEWCRGIAQGAIKQQYPDHHYAESNDEFGKNVIIIEKGGEKKYFFIAYRLPAEINYRMNIQIWLDLIEMKRTIDPESCTLLLIANAGKANPKITIIKNPADLLMKGQFVFEPSEFRLAT